MKYNKLNKRNHNNYKHLQTFNAKKGKEITLRICQN